MSITAVQVNPATIHIYVDGEPVGCVAFEDDYCDWLFKNDHLHHPVAVDKDASAAFLRERMEIARKPDAIRPALEAEHLGRLHMFRDDTADLAAIYGRMQAKKKS